MRIYLIRHGKTKGNIARRYVGTTDEGLFDEAVGELTELKKTYPNELSQISEIFVSPMKRCIETGKILFPHASQVIVDAFRECDFGDFEYRNHEELIGHPYYEKWLRDGGDIAFPGGESKQEFVRRTTDGFLCLLQQIGIAGNNIPPQKAKGDKEGKIAVCSNSLVMVVHGGTIMSILDRFSEPHKDYYDWHAGNGQGYVGNLAFDGEKIVIRELEAI